MFPNKRFLQLSVFLYTVCLTVQLVAAETAKAAAPTAKSKETLFSLLYKGGPLMIPLALCSIIALTIAIERFLSFKKLLYSSSTNFIENFKKAHETGNSDINVLKEFCEKSKTVIAKILEAGIRKWQFSKDWTLTEKALEDISDREVRRMKRSLRPLKNIAAISPLLGLLGTVFGMIHAFQTVALSTASFGKAGKLASGIYEAMVTTAAGLSVAIPTLLVFHFLNNRAETYADEIESICDQFLDKFVHKTEDSTHRGERKMRISRDDDTDGDVINTSSFVDIMFILIIFFMVTMSFNEQEQDISVNLPETDTRLSAATKAMIINIRRDGSYFLMSRKMNLQNIQAELLEALKSNPDQKVLIRGDRYALHGQVAAAIAACKSSGIRDANIGYLTSSPNDRKCIVCVQFN